jgi:predicted O-methyltransferase YrrM
MEIYVDRSKKRSLIESLRTASASTYYKHTYDRYLGRYRISWKNKMDSFTVISLSRFKDFEGYFPKLTFFKDLIPTISTVIETRNKFILKKPVPFIVYDAIKKLDELLSPSDKVLEFGSGNSTLWFLKKKCKVTSLEHSELWYDTLNEHIEKSSDYDEEVLSNFSYHLSENENTWNRIDKMQDESFDLILVDSANQYNNRNTCIEKSISKLKKGGWMVLDNSDHPNNWPGGVQMDDRFERIRFTGLAAMGLYVTQTSLWQKIK